MDIKIWRFSIHNTEQWDMDFLPIFCVHYHTRNSATRVFAWSSKTPRPLSEVESDQLIQICKNKIMSPEEISSIMSTNTLIRMRCVELYEWGHYGITKKGIDLGMQCMEINRLQQMFERLFDDGNENGEWNIIG